VIYIKLVAVALVALFGIGISSLFLLTLLAVRRAR